VSARRTHAGNSLRDGLQQAIADRVAQGIIDGLESIDIQIQEPKLGVSTLRNGHYLHQPVVQQHSIWVNR